MFQTKHMFLLWLIQSEKGIWVKWFKSFWSQNRWLVDWLRILVKTATLQNGHTQNGHKTFCYQNGHNQNGHTAFGQNGHKGRITTKTATLHLVKTTTEGGSLPKRPHNCKMATETINMIPERGRATTKRITLLPILQPQHESLSKTATLSTPCQSAVTRVRLLVDHWYDCERNDVSFQPMVNDEQGIDGLVYLNQCWAIGVWTTRNKLQWNLNRNSYIFIHENAFGNVVWEMAAILSRPQCVNMVWTLPCD